MELRIEREGSLTVLEPRGRLDILSADELRVGYEMLLDQGVVNFVVDLAGLRSVDSTGVGALLGLVKRAEALGGGVHFHSVPASIQAIFELTHLDLVLSLRASREEALATLAVAA